MKITITKTQSKIVQKMQKTAKDGWFSAYNLQCNISTMNALTRKGVVERHTGVGSLLLPRTNIRFRLKSEYRDATLINSYIIP